MASVALLISYIVLTTACGSAIKFAGDWGVTDNLVYASMGTIAFYGLLGTLVNASCGLGCGLATRQLHKLFTFYVPCLGLPFFVGAMMIKNNTYSDNVAYGFVGIGALLAISTLLKCLDQDVIDVVVFAQTSALGGSGYLVDNQFIMGAAVCFACAHFFYSYCSRNCCRNGRKLPPSDLYNYALAGYVYCMLMAASS